MVAEIMCKDYRYDGSLMLFHLRYLWGWQNPCKNVNDRQGHAQNYTRRRIQQQMPFHMLFTLIHSYGQLWCFPLLSSLTQSLPHPPSSAGREGLPEEVLTGRTLLWSRHRRILKGPVQKTVKVIAGQVLLCQVPLSQASQHLQQEHLLLSSQALEMHQAVIWSLLPLSKF